MIRYSSLIKLEQYTQLDRELVNNYEKSKVDPQLELDLPGKSYFKQLPDKYFGPLQLEYPEIEDYHIKTKNLTDTSKEFITNKYIDLLTTPTDKEKAKEQVKDILEINKDPEKAKQRFLEKYKQLRNISIVFYQKYKEANILFEHARNTIREIESYVFGSQASYIDCLKLLPKYFYSKFSIVMVESFGSSNFKSKHYTKLYSVLSKPEVYAPKLFNLDPITLSRSIEQFNDMINEMTSVLEVYDRKHKMLAGFEKKVVAGVNKFLKQAENIEFLNWMEENYSEYKKEIFKSLLGSTFDSDFSTDIIYNFKNYKEVYDAATLKSTEKIKTRGPSIVLEHIQNKLHGILVERVNEKIKPLISFLVNIDATGLEQLKKLFIELDSLCKSNYELNLRSIFNIDLNIKLFELQQSKYSIEEIKEKKEDYFKILITNFFDSLARLIEKRDLDNTINEGVLKYTRSLMQKNIDIDKKNDLTILKNLEQLTSVDLDKIAKHIIRTILYSAHGRNSRYNLFYFVLDNNLKSINVESLADVLTELVPEVPKEFSLHLTKNLFKNNKYNFILTYINRYKDTIKFLTFILKKFNKFTVDNFTNMYNDFDKYHQLYSNIKGQLSSFDDNEIINIILGATRSFNTIIQDLNNLFSFCRFIHNSFNNINTEIMLKLISNSNFINFEKLNIINKLFKAYGMIINEGGLNKIIQTYQKYINDLKNINAISDNFEDNIKFIVDFFESNQSVHPGSPLLQQISEATSRFETDMEMVQMAESIKDLLKNYKPKNENLFKLNKQINDNLRFRVLKDKDPRMLRIGIETDCCQRIGGAGEVAARDSFINPLAGILVLEWKDADNKWKLLTQSYFHYIPKDKGYILDNIEYNKNNVEESKVNLEEIYAYYASEIKAQLKPTYFLAGKGYSKIDKDKFKSYHMNKEDPRRFDPKSLTSGNKYHYSDFDEEDSIDLFRPNFDITNIKNKYQKKEGAVSLREIRKLAFSLQLLGHYVSI